MSTLSNPMNTQVRIKKLYHNHYTDSHSYKALINVKQ